MADSNRANLEECSKLTNNTYANSKNAVKCERRLLTFSNVLLFEKRYMAEKDDFDLLDEVYLYIVEKRYSKEFT